MTIPFALPMTQLAPAVATYVSTNSGTSATSSITFTAQNIGTASADRFVVVGAKISLYTSTMQFSTLSIAGTNGTLLGSLVRPTSNDIAVAFYGRTVTSGTTGDIVITSTAAVIAQATIGVWALTKLRSTTLVTSGSDNTQTANALTISMAAIQQGAVMMAIAAQQGATGFAWTNGSENFDVADAADRVSGASVSYPVGAAAFTLTATGSGGDTDCAMSAIVMR